MIFKGNSNISPIINVNSKIKLWNIAKFKELVLIFIKSP